MAVAAATVGVLVGVRVGVLVGVEVADPLGTLAGSPGNVW